jgi:RNA polymerase primary sigma factor
LALFAVHGPFKGFSPESPVLEESGQKADDWLEESDDEPADEDIVFGDLIEDAQTPEVTNAVSFTLLQEQLHSILDTLSEREAGVVSMRFGLTDGQPKTLNEIGKVYGVTRECIRQIESKTMSKLRHPSRSQVLRDYLD